SGARGWSVSSCDSALLLLRRLGALEQLDSFARRELDDRLLPAPCAALREAAALRLRPHPRDPHLGHGDLEDLFDRTGHLGLGGPVIDPERVLALGDQRVALLRDDRPDDHRARVHQASLSRSLSIAASEITSEAAPMTSATPISPASATCTLGR